MEDLVLCEVIIPYGVNKQYLCAFRLLNYALIGLSRGPVYQSFEVKIGVYRFIKKGSLWIPANTSYDELREEKMILRVLNSQVLPREFDETLISIKKEMDSLDIFH